MVNKVILIGNLGADPEIRYTQSGTPVANFNLATSETWRNQDGSKEERTEWHRIVAWRRLAEICGEYLNKGTRVYIEGSIRTRKWEDRDGNPRYTTEIEAREMKILSPRSGGGGGEYGGGGGSNFTQEQSSYEPPPGVGDDVPF
ncbi:single-stranded DNA-binding protein [Desulfolithobacter dissulfuricans]|uniref:Single-stranded DNA-binding protein n=1 Tax=Desulfolithobacter dissulfuricans TaxID=2795293 RepID=A0A915U5I4_9BACT|nr:single-stranded DNA-binding protein [Desulfolithobacter dissulfuricans]BCO09112.1 single-stranded DNA-binding protein [Desulfolithobacter dissulfuricans]